MPLNTLPNHTGPANKTLPTFFYPYYHFGFLKKYGKTYKMNIEKTIKTNKWRYIAATIAPFLLIVLSLYFIVGYIHNEIDSTKSEIDGIHDIHQLHNATLTLQKIRGLTNIKLHGGDVPDRRLNSFKKDADAILKELISDKHSIIFKFSQTLRNAYSRMGSIFSREGEDLSPAIHFNEYSNLIDDLMHIRQKVSAESKLVLDSELYSYYLMNLMVKQVPDLTESIGQVRGTAAGIAVQGSLSKKNRRRLIEIVGHVKHDLTEFTTAGKIIFDISPDETIPAKVLFTRVEDDVNNYLVEIERILKDKQTTLSPMQLFDEGTAIIDKSDLIFKELSEQLNELLKKRTTRLNNILIYTVVGILLAVALTSYFIFSFYRSNRQAFNSLKKHSEAQLKAKEETERSKDTLIVLSQIGFESMDYNLALITEQASQTVKSERLSVWLFNNDRSEMVCHDLFIGETGLHEKGTVLCAKDFPLYFDSLRNNEIIRADDVETYPCTREFTEIYLRPLGITSMLDVPVWQNGVTQGVICCEHIGGKRVWTDEEVDFLSNMALIVAQTLEADELRRVEEERLRVIEDLNFANKELKDFAYIVSHDLKAPLRAIGSLTNWLWEDYGDKLGEEGKEQLDLLSGRVKRMDALINGILSYSRAGIINEDKSEVDLNDTLLEVIETIVPPEGISVSLSERLPRINCEKTRIFQVFQNLVSNGIKYMDKPDGEIKIGYSEDQGNMVFSVSDNGPGIEEKYFKKIFTIFQTLNPRDDVEGTGVGLSLVKKIVEMYDGKVWIASEQGKGSTFYFSLPASMLA